MKGICLLAGLDVCVFICKPGSFRNRQIIALCCALVANPLRCHLRNTIYGLESVPALMKHLPSFGPKHRGFPEQCEEATDVHPRELLSKGGSLLPRARGITDQW